jgi:hypothetical protein
MERIQREMRDASETPAVPTSTVSALTLGAKHKKAKADISKPFLQSVLMLGW